MSSPQASPFSSTFFFPLSTNVGYFDSPERFLTLADRVKQASLLYEKLIFEEGVYGATVWETGSQEIWFPPEEIEQEWFVDKRSNFQPSGGEEYFAIQTESMNEPIVLNSGTVERRFMCEFHSTLRELNAENLPWIEIQSFELTQYGQKQASSLHRSMEHDFKDLLPEANRFLKQQIIKNLSKDLTLSAFMEVSSSVDGIYAPLLHQYKGVQPAPGFAALQISVPNLTHLPWDKILEIRDKDCLIEFRQKMAVLESMAREALPEGEIQEIEYQNILSQTFIQELAREMAQYQPSTGALVGDVAIDFVAGLIPIPGVSTALTAIRGTAELKEAKKSWIAAWLQLRNP